MTKGRIIGALVALVIIAGIVGAVLLNARNSVPEVAVASAEREDLGVTVAASGKVESDEKADVYPPGATTIEDLRVEDGQTVKAGQILAVLDEGPLEAQVNQARAAYRQAAAQVEQVGSQAPSGADRSAAAANVNAAYKAYQSANQSNADARRASREATNSIVRAAADALVRQTATQAQQAYAQYLGAKAQQAKLSGTSVTAARDAAIASRDAAAEALKMAQDNLDDAELRAPIAGTVLFSAGGGGASLAALSGAGGGAGAGAGGGSSSTLSEGAAVSPQAPVFTIVQLDSLRFNADVDEVDVTKIKAGMKMSVTLDAFPDESFETTVSRIQPQAVQTATGGTVFPVFCSLAGTGKRILIGMKGDAEIETSALKGALTVPVEAVLEDGDQSYVFVIEGETARRRDVKVGTLTDTRAQILSGLDEGDQVVTSGSASLKDGAAVRTK